MGILSLEEKQKLKTTQLRIIGMGSRLSLSERNLDMIDSHRTDSISDSNLLDERGKRYLAAWPR